MKKNLTTKLLHTPFPKKDPHSSLNFPVYDSVAFDAETSEELEAAFHGEKYKHLYSRITNPTVEYFEAKIRNITEAFAVTALSSGMAAISNLILTISRSGDNIVTTRHLFGNTFSLLEKTLKPFGLEGRYTDLTDPQKVRDMVDSRTVAIFFETITNPQMEVVDVQSLAKIAREKNILLIGDTTLTPPSVCDARELGMDIEILSSTKYISGGATSVGGLIVDYGTYDWSLLEKMKMAVDQHGPYAFNVMLRRQVYRNMGACLSPHNAFLQSLGLDTLVMRSERASSNALEIANWLSEQPQVKDVNYPGHKSSPYRDVAVAQYGTTPCSLLTFDLESKKACFDFMDRLQVVRRATNLQDNKTLIIHPSSTIFAEYTEEQKAEMGLRHTMIRLSVGIEDVEDLIADLRQALAQDPGERASR